MNPIETPTTTTEHSLSKRVLPLPSPCEDGTISINCGGGSGGGGVSSHVSNSNNSIIKVHDQTPAFYGDKALIKRVIGVGPSNNNNYNQHSILKKTTSGTTTTTTTTSTSSSSTSNSIIKAIVRPNADALAVVKSQQQLILHQKQQSASLFRSCSEFKSQQKQQHIFSPCSSSISATNYPSDCHQIIIKSCVSSSNLPGLSEKLQTYNTTVKRPHQMLQHKTFPTPTPCSIGMQMQPSSSSSQIIYKSLNGHSSSSNCSDIMKSSLLHRPLPMTTKPTTAEQLLSKRPSPPSTRDIQIMGNPAEQLTKRRQSMVSSAEQLTKRRPSIRDLQIMHGNGNGKNIDSNEQTMNIRRISRNSSSSETNPSSLEVTQISSTVTLTKSATTSKQQSKTPPSPMVTIEKNGNSVSVLNGPKQATRSLYSSNESVNETGRKSLLINQRTSPPTTTNIVKSPPKQTAARPFLKGRQQSLLKVNSLARLLHTSPRSKRSKSMTAVGNPIKKRCRPARKNRRLSTASDGELLQKAVEQLSLEHREVIKKKEPSQQAMVVVSPTNANANASLLCNDKIETIPSSSSNNSSLEITPQKESTLEFKMEIKVEPNLEPNVGPKVEAKIGPKVGPKVEAKLTTKTDINLGPRLEVKVVDKAAYVNTNHMNMVLGMLSTFNMLKWKERVGICKQSEMKFQLNELNLIQIAEKCPTRYQMPSAFDKPIFDRNQTIKSGEYTNALYCCRRCECHGAAIDFLAPDFCSYDCFRRESRKRTKITAINRKNMVRERFKKLKAAPVPVVRDVYSPEIQIKHLIPKRFFTWASYLSANDAVPAPIDLFPNPFPCEANLFEVGMKLEAIDPEHNSLFCVCTVAEKKGYRLKLKFDGYSKIHNFWVNADSMDIFPPGWCAKTNRVLQPPKGINLLNFNWPTYLKSCKSMPAPRSLFTHLNSSSTGNPFKIGMRLEAVDLKNTGKICVATVADVLDNRILVHFDGWDESYDYWIDINSPFIHPIGWHEKNNLELVPPPDWEEYFDWPEYLEFMRSEAAWPTMFSQRDPIQFSSGMKLEVVDFKNPSLIRPATVLCCNEYKVLVHLDGWPSGVTYWVNDDSPDIHPIRWTEETGHDLEPPPGFEQIDQIMPCPVLGCRGIGHATRMDVAFHANRHTCPYVEENWNIEIERPSRVDEVGRFTYEDKLLIKKNIEDISPELVEDIIKQEPDRKSPKIEQNNSHPSVDRQLTISKVVGKQTQQQQQQHQENVKLIDKEIKIAHEYLCDYGPRLKQNYKIWCNNGNFNSNSIKKNPLEWTTEETAQYITLKCHPIGHLFKREDIDGAALLSMHQSDLTDILKLKLGPSIKIFSHILHLRNQVVSKFIKT